MNLKVPIELLDELAETVIRSTSRHALRGQLWRVAVVHIAGRCPTAQPGASQNRCGLAQQALNAGYLCFAARGMSLQHLWVELVGNLIVARLRGTATDELVIDCQARVLGIVKHMGKHCVLYDMLELDPPAVEVVWKQRALGNI